MGGGSGFTYSEASDLDKKLEESRQDIAYQKYDSEVDTLIADQLIDANRRDTVAINAHIEEIKNAIESDFKDSESIITIVPSGAIS